MATATLTCTAWGLDAGGDGWHWRMRAACSGDDRYTDTLALSRTPTFGTGRVPTLLALQLIHRCVNHCPVLAQCTEATRRHLPIGMVQAGRLWPEGHRGPREVREIGHGPHCAGGV